MNILKVAVSVPVYRVADRLDTGKNGVPWRRGYARWVRREVERAGCLYVKVGQWVSSRTDIFPPEITDELASLRNSSAAMPEADVERIFLDLGIADYDVVPLSTGSIAQVHRAVVDGRAVAVKVQRPGILSALHRDVSVIKFVLGIGGGGDNPKMRDDLENSLSDLVETVVRELDFLAEASHMRRFADFFDSKDYIAVPRVISATETAIVMDFIDARPWTGSPDVLMTSFLRQFFELGWLHTDMHAGNIGQLDDGTLVLFDFGSVLRVPPEIQLCIRHLMVSYLNRNVGVMLDYMVEYGLLVGAAPPGPREREMLCEFLETVLQYVEKTDIRDFAGAVKKIPVYDSPTNVFRGEIFMIMRSFTLLEGACKDIDPDFVILDAVEPFAMELARDTMMWRLKIEDDIRNFVTGMNDDAYM